MNDFKRDANGRRIFPACYVCGGEAHDRTIEERLQTRARNVVVILATPGNEKHPDGLVRHSLCEPGTERWAASQQSNSKWARAFGFIRRGGKWTRERGGAK